MQIAEIRDIFDTGDKQRIEMMARGILVHGRSHEYMQQLSQHAEEFDDLLSTTDPADKDYLILVYILVEHLKEIKNGACPCSIIKKPMYNSPDRLGGILKILNEELDADGYEIGVHSKCLACGNEYESRTVESGFGYKVIWQDRQPHR